MNLVSFFSRKKDVRERRQHYRSELPNLLSIDLPPRLILNLSDISQGGLQFSSPKRLTANELVNLTVNLAQSEKQIQALGRVTWSQRISKTGDAVYRIGIAFQELSKEAALAIRQLELAFCRGS